MRVFFQIGTNDGDDLFRDIARAHRPDFVILVEPNVELADTIKKNYAGIDNVIVYSRAIYYRSGEKVTLVAPAKNGHLGMRADNGYSYTHLHFSLFPMNDWGSTSDMARISADTITFDDICKAHNITTIDYLQIDTEGFDSEIISMIDFTKYTVHQIRFERWSFDTSAFTTHNAAVAKRLGKNGMKIAMDTLERNGYVLKDIVDSDGVDIIATLTPRTVF